MMADTSPEWKKPADIMKLRRKTLCTRVATSRTTVAPRSRLSIDTSSPGRKAQKRKNPFACLPSTQVTKDNDENTEIGDSTGDSEAEVYHTEAASCFIDVLVWCFVMVWKHRCILNINLDCGGSHCCYFLLCATMLALQALY